MGIGGENMAATYSGETPVIEMIVLGYCKERMRGLLLLYMDVLLFYYVIPPWLPKRYVSWMSTWN